MPRPRHILAIDQGTTSTRAIVFDDAARPVCTARQEFEQYFPADGWVEHDPEEIWRSTVEVCRRALTELRASGDEVHAIGITNQRETTVVWDRSSGAPVCPAIVWQDRRTADACERLVRGGHERMVRERTGLLLDPYFSATKLAWILDNVEGVRRKAEAGELAFGTTDSFLLWRLTEGRVHATDATNASRTLLFNIHTGEWDEELLRLFDIPTSLLPEVRDSADDYGEASAGVLGRSIAIGGVVGDQQAATIGQSCFEPGMAKSTYGTGAFVMMNTGEHPPLSKNRLLTTIGYRIGGRVTYALEGSIFVAGAAVQWLRDGLGVIGSAAETESLARSLASNQGVYMVPAFTGLGAPHWDPRARGAIFGLTRDARAATLARAALEAVCYQTDDLLRAMAGDVGRRLAVLRVDGGMVGNDWLMQFLADILNIPVERPLVAETTALGAACLAGLQTGAFASFAALAARREVDRRFEPRMDAAERESLIEGWRRAVSRVTGSGFE